MVAEKNNAVYISACTKLQLFDIIKRLSHFKGDVQCAQLITNF